MDEKDYLKKLSSGLYKYPKEKLWELRGTLLKLLDSTEYRLGLERYDEGINIPGIYCEICQARLAIIGSTDTQFIVKCRGCNADFIMSGAQLGIQPPTPKERAPRARVSNERDVNTDANGDRYFLDE